MSCSYCRNDAVYKCSVCGRLTCGEHVTLRTMCSACIKKTTSKFIIDKVNTDREREATRELVKRFWGEEEQLTFDKKFTVAELPTFIAKSNNNIFGFISFAETAGATIIVALGVLPKYQDVRIGKSLVKKVEDEVKKLQRKRLLVSASNDDLPALAFYQSLGFQIYEVKPNVIAEKHGKVLKGIGGLPIRDELRLQKTLS